MVQHEIKLRVRYGQTDKMGYLYYGHYASYFEIGRTEFMRALGMPYRVLEDEYGIMLPVSSMNMRFVRPAKYDDLVRVVTMIKHFSLKSVIFRTELYNGQNKLMNAGEVKLNFVSIKDMKGTEAPQDLVDLLTPYLNGEKTVIE